MATVYPTIDSTLREWIGQQHLFFVASAPLSDEGLINLSPKGLDTFTILDEQTVAYLDLTGSGVETLAHLKENGRLVIMFCAFDGPARIVRFHGKGEAIEPGHPDFSELCSHFPPLPGIRSVIRLGVTRISDSCGYGVPLYDFKRERDALVKNAQNLGPDGVLAYQRKQNAVSLDGLPGLRIDD